MWVCFVLFHFLYLCCWLWGLQAQCSWVINLSELCLASGRLVTEKSLLPGTRKNQSCSAHLCDINQDFYMQIKMYYQSKSKCGVAAVHNILFLLYWNARFPSNLPRIQFCSWALSLSCTQQIHISPYMTFSPFISSVTLGLMKVNQDVKLSLTALTTTSHSFTLTGSYVPLPLSAWQLSGTFQSPSRMPLLTFLCFSLQDFSFHSLLFLPRLSPRRSDDTDSGTR